MKYLDPVRDEIDRLRSELALVNDTLRYRTQAHQRVIDSLEELRAIVAACPTCSTRLEPTT